MSARTEALRARDEPSSDGPQPLVIVGPTASGKSDVAMAIAAERPGSEIVAVDAMQVYRGMDIGTAKPTVADRAAVAHHGIDLVDIGDEFTVTQFQAAARGALGAIEHHGGLPILVGGTGLYVRAVVDALEIPGTWPEVRAELTARAATEGTEALHRELVAVDPVAAGRIEPSNDRRVVRALEVCLGSGRPFSSFGPGLDRYEPVPFVQIGLRWRRDELARRVERRVRQMLQAGFVEEVRALRDTHPSWSRTARHALGYEEVLDHLDGRTSLADAAALISLRTRQYAVRQERWFRRDPRIRWVEVHGDPVAEALPVIRSAMRPATRDPHPPATTARGTTAHDTLRHDTLRHDTMTITLTKHHGLGNDFLVLDLAQGRPEVPWPALARRWCDRRRGIGADGLLLLGIVDDAELAMQLLNADGSVAEMSGNGIRCLAQAAFLAQGRSAPVDYVVHTDAGDRHVHVASVDGVTIEASVEMGDVVLIDEPVDWHRVGADTHRPVAHVSVGNPHSVVGVEDVAAVDLVAIGSVVPYVNLEIIEPGPEPHAITMRVHERGAGVTEACGTGACASAWVAVSWGLVAGSVEEVLVHMDGGDARVRLADASATLIGPAVLIGTVQVEV